MDGLRARGLGGLDDALLRERDLLEGQLDAEVAAAGYSISDGKLVWAEPAADGSDVERAGYVGALREANSGSYGPW